MAGEYSPFVAARPHGEVVAAPVHCRRCGYNLFGLRADGSCPECGLETWESILHTVDPAASRLPRLANPLAIGNALLWLMVCMALAALLVVLRPLTMWLDALDSSGLRNFSAWAPVLSLLAGIVVMAALRAVFWLAPQTGSDSGVAVWRDIWLLGSGLAAWSVLAVAVATLELTGVIGLLPGAGRLAMAISAIAVLLGLRGILGLIGTRSREYRTARGGRQSVAAMIGAIIGLGAGYTLQLVDRAAVGGAAPLATLGTVITAISALMLVIGLLYMVVNAWWIRRSLRRPPPSWDEILQAS